MTALDPKLEQKLLAMRSRYEELGQALSEPDVVSDLERYRNTSKAYADLRPVVAMHEEYGKVAADLAGARELVIGADDPEMKAMAEEEVAALGARAQQLEQDLKVALLPVDPNDAKNVVLEIRAGTGGDEASLFASELFRMYARYAERQGWKMQTSDLSESGIGGLKEVIAIVEGERVYSRLKFESGVHRVQRVPATEASGRIHTSAVTVAVLPEADEVDIQVEEKDLRIDSFCASGPGGQSVNTTYSAVRIVHLPTNTVVQCQDEKSWHKNKARALQVLRARLYERKLREQQEAIAKERRGMIGSGDRSEKIRTYNFPQDRVTDHRIKVNLSNLPSVMEGEIDGFVHELRQLDQAERLQNAGLS
jgi:peptide chain release factor 1